MIQRHWTYDIWPAGKRNDTNAIVWTAFDKFSRHFSDCVHARRFLAADRKIFGQHRSGDIKHEHNIDPARVYLSKTLAELRTRECDGENRQRCKQQGSKDFSSARGALFSNGAKSRCRRERQGGSRPAFPAQIGEQRNRE